MLAAPDNLREALSSFAASSWDALIRFADLSVRGEVMATKGKVLVSMRALIQRINRKLRHNGEVLKVARGSRAEAEADVGRYFIVNIKRNLLVNDHCDPEAVGREIGVMAEYERLVED
jgi:hypothetical protein